MEEPLDDLKRQITTLTEIGRKTLANGSPDEASEIFRHVCNLAEQTKDDFMRRGCYFNLGACYVACQQPKLGLKYLEQAIPPDGVEDGIENYADLWYNIGIANHALGNIDKAVVGYEKAQISYHTLSAKRLEGGCLCKLAVCYHLKYRLKDTYDMYFKSQEIYYELGDKNSQALSLVSATGVLSEIGDIDGCAKLLDQLLDVCQEIEDKHLQAKIYHDIGLLYISEKLYESAAECFEQALKCLEQALVIDKSLKATIMQNIGATCNYLMLYDRAITFHQFAADLYGEVGDRKAQTQVFCNLAFAQTKKESYNEAIASFQHAVQAGKDCGDKESQCLATEGLAAIYFRQKNYEKAISFYKDSLSLLSLSKEKDSKHADRIVDKLADALQSSLRDEVDGRERRIDSPVKHKVVIKQSRPRISREHTQYSLVAKGLEEISSVEDSSEQDSNESSDETESNQDEENTYLIQNDEKQSRYINEEYLEENIHQQNGVHFSTKSALNRHTHEQQKDYEDDVPRADKEYYLAVVAQKQAERQKEASAKVDDRKEPSKMCCVM